VIGRNNTIMGNSDSEPSSEEQKALSEWQTKCQENVIAREACYASRGQVTPEEYSSEITSLNLQKDKLLKLLPTGISLAQARAKLMACVVPVLNFYSIIKHYL
jgi:sulfur relay (sulfurtransferase) complex TusBCD TusD component (DsrE family)